MTSTTSAADPARPAPAAPDPMALLRSRAYVRLPPPRRSARAAHLGPGVLLPPAGRAPAAMGVPRPAGRVGRRRGSGLVAPAGAGRGRPRGRPRHQAPAGQGGHSPADGFQAGHGPPPTRYLAGIALAAVVSLGLGVVLGPEAPLIALGGGLAAMVAPAGPAARGLTTVRSPWSDPPGASPRSAPCSARRSRVRSSDGDRRSGWSDAGPGAAPRPCSPPGLGALVFVGLGSVHRPRVGVAGHPRPAADRLGRS